MMAQSTDGGNAEDFSPKRIRRRIPNNVPDQYQRLLIASIRNPDADMTEIAVANGVESSRVFEALTKLAQGYWDSNPYDPERYSKWYKKRGESRLAKSFDELTEIQQAIVDTMARHPEWCENAMQREIAERAIAEHDVDPFTEGNVKHVLDLYPDMPEERRLDLIMRGEISEEDADSDYDSRYENRDVRELLDLAGWDEDDLPASNLDSLEPFETAGEIAQNNANDADEARNDRSAESGATNMAIADLESDEPSIKCEQCEQTFDSMDAALDHECFTFSIVDEWADLETLPDGSHDDDIQHDALYRGEVNNIGRHDNGKHYGVYVSLTEPRDPANPRSDVSGLLKEEHMFRTPVAYSPGDEIAVELESHHYKYGPRFREVVVREEVDEILRERFEDHADEEPDTDAGDDTADDSAEDQPEPEERDQRFGPSLADRYGALEQRQQEIRSEVDAALELLEKLAETVNKPDAAEKYSDLREDVSALQAEMDAVPDKGEIYSEVDKALSERLEALEAASEPREPSDVDATPGVDAPETHSDYAAFAVHAIQRYIDRGVPGQLDIGGAGDKDVKHIGLTLGEGGSLGENQLALDAITSFDAERKVDEFKHEANGGSAASIVICFGEKREGATGGTIAGPNGGEDADQEDGDE